MFSNTATPNSTNTSTSTATETPPERSTGSEPILQIAKYKNAIPSIANGEPANMHYNVIDQLLETEKQHNKADAWNKLDKTQKTLILHSFAEKHGRETGMPVKDIKRLKMFFSECLDKSKLQKTKDVVYNKETREIVSIPSLYFNQTTHSYSLKNLDPKRVSTLKSLTPKRNITQSSESLALS
jgi:hypothetical protein